MSIITETMIANKALQRVGADAIGLVDDTETVWTEISRNAKEIRKTYDITRRFELRRNVWRFAIRTQVLRPIDTDSRLITFPTWTVGADYNMNDIVVGSDGTTWIAKQAMVHPGADPILHEWNEWDNYFGNLVAHPYDATTTFMAGEIAYVGSTVYIALQNDNTGNTPASSPTFWQELTGPTLATINFIYPIGAGPASNQQTKNVYMLPYGWVREAPQSPKSGSLMPLGAPSNLNYSDWNYEGAYFTSVLTGPIPYRFVADIEDPDAWDPMFVNGFACALALDVCEPITQSTAKIGQIGNAYIKFMSEARTVNGIETGPVEPPLDRYLAARL